MPAILPVIDLKGGVVVRGVAGQRENYQPVESVLTNDASPSAVAKAFRDLGYDDVYVADLDAIAGDEPAWNDYQAILVRGLGLWIDAGAAGLQRAHELAQWLDANAKMSSSHRIIVALENLRDDAQLAQMAQKIDPARLVFSMALKQGLPLAVAPGWRHADPLEIAHDVIGCGIHRLIVLDLARVGVGQGTGTEDLCRAMKKRWPHVELIGGAGVNSRHEVERLAECGLSRVLVASALHDGRVA